MRGAIFALALVLSCAALAATPAEWQTRFESSDSLETSTYDETVDYCQRLADTIPALEFYSFGVSPEGRDLPMLTVGMRERARQHQPLLLILAGIHAGEIDGKDAGLLLLRDALVFGRHPGLFDHVRVMFVPIFNVDGHERRSAFARANQNGPRETGWRTTAQNYNLNRDFMKADAPEMRALLTELQKHDPDFLVDIHVTDGADYQYTISYALNDHEDAPPPLRQYNREVFLPELKQRMRQSGWDFPTYITFKDWGRIESGWESDVAVPRLSHGYGTLRNHPALLIETHSLKPYALRVRATYDLLVALLETLGRQANELQAAVRASDELASQLPGQNYLLNWSLTGDSTLVDFAGVDYHREFSPTLGDSVIRWGDTPRTYRIPWYSTSIPADTITVPYGYLIPRAWLPAIRDILQLHHIPIVTLNEAVTVQADGYRFTHVRFPARSYEGRQRPEFEVTSFSGTVEFAAGSAFVPLNTPTAPIALHLLEPRAPDSFVRWGFFNPIFEQKEYAEAYVMDTIAVRLLTENPGLASEFQTRLADSAFAASPEARLQFFYERSPYWDTRKDLYPIYRITTQSEAARFLPAKQTN